MSLDRLPLVHNFNLAEAMAVRQFVLDAGWTIVSEAAAPHSCLEHQALRQSWLRACEAMGMGEEQARAAGSGLYRRAAS